MAIIPQSTGETDTAVTGQLEPANGDTAVPPSEQQQAQDTAVPGQPEPAHGDTAVSRPEQQQAQDTAVTGRRFAYVPNVGAWQRVGKYIRITTIINRSGEFFGRWHRFNGLIPFSSPSHEANKHTRGSLVRWEPSQPEPINLEIICKGLDGVDLLQVARVDDFLVKLGVAFPETRPDLLQAMQDADYATLLPELRKNCDVWQREGTAVTGLPKPVNDDTAVLPPEQKEAQGTAVTLNIWEKIPDIGYDRLLVELWQGGLNGAEIAPKVGRQPKAVYNRISELRRRHKTDLPDLLPYRKT